MAIKTPGQVAERPQFIKSDINWKRYFFEFLSIFFAVILAFALNSWNDNRKLENAETNILKEMYNGLNLDSVDVAGNIYGHKTGIMAVSYFRRLVQGYPVGVDSIGVFRKVLLRDYISMQNTSGYESLKSQGLDVIKDDSLRVEIIKLYEYNYKLIEKIEEQYAAQQFFKAYSNRINDAIAPSLVFDENGELEQIQTPLNLSKTQRNKILSDIGLIEENRKFTLGFYTDVSKQIGKTKAMIGKELTRRK